MIESQIEARLRKEVEKRGGKAKKFTSPGWRGVPDRIVLLPGGRILFVELKAPDKKLEPLQVKRAQELQSLGFSVYRLDSMAAVKAFLVEVFPG